MTDKEMSLIDEIIKNQGLERFLMDREEIKMADLLVKRGILTKGIADTKQGGVKYYILTERIN